jgi:hypothetical protein
MINAMIQLSTLFLALALRLFVNDSSLVVIIALATVDVKGSTRPSLRRPLQFSSLVHFGK